MPTEVVSALRRTLATVDKLIEEAGKTKLTRPLKQMEGVGSCAACRSQKARCSNRDDGTPCERCVKMGLACEYPARERPGRKKGYGKRLLLLQETRQDLLDVLDAVNTSGIFPHTWESPVASTSSSTIGTTAPPAVAVPIATSVSSSSLDSVSQDQLAALESPLAILANLRLADSDDVHHDAATSDPRDAWMVQAQKFYSTGLYDTRDDVDLANDPVLLGLLKETDLARLVKMYFDSLWPYFWHLTLEIHTCRFLRDTSPFLTTCLAAAVSMYDPLCTPTQTRALQAHAEYLAVEVFRQQQRTIEVVQGFCFLAHWVPPAENWSQDRSYSWIGMAVRIATQLCLQEPFKPSDFNRYRLLTPIGDALYPALCESRTRTWTLLFCTDLAVSVHTGRLSAFNGLMFTAGTLSRATPPPITDPYYSCRANEALNRILVKAAVYASSLEQSLTKLNDLRDTFDSAWRTDLKQWSSDWTAVSMFVRLQYSHIKLMLLSLSLRFPGATQPILAERQSEALQIVHMIASEADVGINYASNYAVVVIAYGAITALNFVNAAETSRQPEATRQILDMCSKVVQALLRIARARPNAPSMASVHAVRISRLISSVTDANATPLIPSSTPTPVVATAPPFALDDPNFDLSTWLPPTGMEPLSMDFMGGLDELGSLEQQTSLVDFWSWDSGIGAAATVTFATNDLLGDVGGFGG